MTDLKELRLRLTDLAHAELERSGAPSYIWAPDIIAEFEAAVRVESYNDGYEEGKADGCECSVADAWGEGFRAGRSADHNSDWWPPNPYRGGAS